MARATTLLVLLASAARVASLQVLSHKTPPMVFESSELRRIQTSSAKKSDSPVPRKSESILRPNIDRAAHFEAKHALIKQQAEDEAERLTILGAAVNVGLSASKAVAGAAARSPVLIADAAHSLSDLCTDAGVWWALMVGRRAPSRQHPEGFGKFGALSSLAISGLLISLAGAFFRASVASMIAVVRNRAHAEPVTRAARCAALLTAAASIASKEWLARATMRAGKRCGSLAITANAAHHRADALSSVAALFGLAGAALGLPVLDPLASLAVAGCIAHTGVEVGAEALEELTDASVGADTMRELEDALEGNGQRRARLEHACHGGGGQVVAQVALEMHATASAAEIQRIQLKVESCLRRVTPNLAVRFTLNVAENDADSVDESKEWLLSASTKRRIGEWRVGPSVTDRDASERAPCPLLVGLAASHSPQLSLP